MEAWSARANVILRKGTAAHESRGAGPFDSRAVQAPAGIMLRGKKNGRRASQVQL